MSEIDLTQYDEQIVARRYEIVGILTNIHGEHAERTQIISGVVFDETRTLTEGEKEKIESKKAKSSRPETVHTFPKDEEGFLLVPFGGMHGYVMGALRTALVDLYKDKLNDRNWKGYGLGTYVEHSFDIKPQWIRVGKNYSNPVEQPVARMVITAGISRAMMPIFYDIVNRVEINFVIEQMNTKISEDIFLPMLAYIQRLGLGPKGRGQLQITKCTKTKGD